MMYLILQLSRVLRRFSHREVGTIRCAQVEQDHGEGEECSRGITPSHFLKAFDKFTETGAKVGAGWLNENGSISIRLNLCTVLALRITI